MGPSSCRARPPCLVRVGVGVAVAFVIALAADQPEIGVGIGGAIAAIGAAMIVNGVLGARETHLAPAARRETPALPGDLQARE